MSTKGGKDRDINSKCLGNTLTFDGMWSLCGDQIWKLSLGETMIFIWEKLGHLKELYGFQFKTFGSRVLYNGMSYQ
jgi:hypothetical protein